MRVTSALLLALPALAAAEAQEPLTDKVKGWFAAATSSILNAVPSAPTIPAAVKSPVAAAAAKGASKVVHKLTMRNYEELLAPDLARAGPTEWLVLISGGNKTCGGRCTRLEVAFNETASLLAADLTAPKLGYVNCDDQRVLCATWQAQPPTIWHIQRPHPKKGEQSTPASTVRINYLRFNETRAQDMVALHTGKKYEDGLVYEGYFQPFDGLLKQYNVNKVAGYIFFAVGLLPSWAYMLVISMITRTVM